jgi:hypothetical protein
VKLYGYFSNINGITSTTTGDLITSTVSVTIEKLTISSSTATKIFSLAAAGVYVVFIVDCVVNGTSPIGTIDTYNTVFISTNIFINATDGVTFSGGSREILLKDNLVYSFTGTFIDLNGSTAFAIVISNHSVTAATGATFLDIAPNGANLTADGQGTITSNKVDDSGGDLQHYPVKTSNKRSWRNY